MEREISVKRLVFIGLVLITCASLLSALYAPSEMLEMSETNKEIESRYKLVYSYIKRIPSRHLMTRHPVILSYFFYDDVRTKYGLDLFICVDQFDRILYGGKLDGKGWHCKGFRSFSQGVLKKII